MTVDVDSLLDRYAALPAVGVEALEGCTLAEIEEIRVGQGVPVLPPDVLRFLSRAGRRGGPLLVGSEAYYPDLVEAKIVANEILEEDGENWRLGDSSLVIMTHQGYMFYWIPDVASYPTEVRRYIGGPEPIVSAGTFVDYLAGMMGPQFDWHELHGGTP